MKLLNYIRRSENSVAIILATSMMSLSYPYGFPLVSPLILLIVALNFISKNINFRINTGFILFFICVLFYMFGMSMNGGIIYGYNKTDITNIISFLLFWTILSNLRKENFPLMLDKFAKLTVFLSLIVSVISLYKFMKLINGVRLNQFFAPNLSYPNGSSLVVDYNMFSLGMFSGLVMSVYLMSKAKNITHLIYYLTAFMTIFCSVIFAGSRRGWVIAISLLIFVILMAFKYIFTHRFEKNVMRFLKLSFAIAFISVFLLLNLILFDINIDIKNSPQVEQLKYRFQTLQLDRVDDSFSNSRTVLWDYAVHLFGEYNLLQLIIGSGFSYIPDFGNTFSTGSEGYPHSPIHSALLYSGLFGALAILIFLVWVIYKSLKHRKLIKLYFPLLFLISLTFVSISANSLFSITPFILIAITIISIPDKQHIPSN